jgi:ParB/RepB/Spo0J family partition protein
MEPRVIATERIRILAGHNARRQIGDVSDLAASIRANGVLQALTVVELPEEDGQPVYGVVAGERRLTAARQIGLDEVPCLVRDLDERQRTVAMLVENLQRQDLDPLEEASGIQRLVAMGLSQRQIAGELGCSQSHVSKRLALLGLPDEVRTAIAQPADSGGITVNDALELTRLSDHPELLSEAFERGRRGLYGGVTGQVRSALEDVRREQARAEARSRIMSAGVRILKEEPYYSWYGRKETPLLFCGHDNLAIPLTVEQHQGEPCHAAAIDREGKVTLVCRDPSRHGLVDARKAQEQREQKHQREQAKERAAAAAARRETIATVLAAANTSQLPFAARQVLEGWRVDESRLACQLLGIPAKPAKYGPSWTDALGEYAGRSMGAAIKALLALALASGEQIVTSTWGGVNERSKRHLELLVAAGHRPAAIDRKHLEGPVADEEDDVPRCRVCGCSDEQACEGGCTWVEDPEGLGDLCSRCLHEAATALRGTGHCDDAGEDLDA